MVNSSIKPSSSFMIATKEITLAPPLFPLPLEAILILIFLNPSPKSTPWRGLDWREYKKLRIKRTQLYQVIFRMACHICYDCIGIFLQDILPFLSLRIYKYHKSLNISFPNREINSCLKSYDKLQPENAPFPISVTLSGMTILDKELQYSYLMLVDYQYYTL